MRPAPNRRILIIDDEPEIREGYKSALNPRLAPRLASSRMVTGAPNPAGEEGPVFEISEAENGEQALEIYTRAVQEGKPFACAIVDVRMPGRLDGLQFIREAWKIDSTTRMVVATAYQDRSVNEIDRFFGTEFQDQWDYLSKPFTAGEIIQKARQMSSAWNRQLREKEYLTQIQSQQDTLIGQERLAAVGRLARSIGHEFGNILQPLITKLEIAREQAEAETQKVLFDEMLEAVTLGAHICQDLLTFSRESHSGKGEVPLTNYSVSEVVEKSLRLLRHELKKKDIQVKNTASNLPIQIQEARMVQALINFFTNSIHAMKDGGSLTISTHSAEGNVVLEIQDTGRGISASDLEHIFEPLFTTKGDKGNGLGLSVAKQIIENFSGTVALTSQEGKGTQVTIKLPSPK